MRLPNTDAPLVMSATLLSRRSSCSRSSSMPARDNPVSACPAQAVLGSRARPVFAADPFIVTEAIECREDCRIVHPAFIGLPAQGNTCDLHMTDQAKMLLQPPDEIAAHDLDMIEVELDTHIRPRNLVDDVGGVLDPAEEIVRAVTWIERLDQERDVAFAHRISRPNEVADEGGLPGWGL